MWALFLALQVVDTWREALIGTSSQVYESFAYSNLADRTRYHDNSRIFVLGWKDALNNSTTVTFHNNSVTMDVLVLVG